MPGSSVGRATEAEMLQDELPLEKSRRKVKRQRGRIVAGGSRLSEFGVRRSTVHAKTR